MIQSKSTFNKLISILVFPGGKVGFVAFIVISAWFLVDSSFKIKKFLKTYIQVMFYTASLTLLSIVLGVNISINNLIASFFPIAGNSHGFAATYLAFYLVLPYLNLLLINLNNRKLKLLVIILIYYQVITQILSVIFDYHVVLLSSEMLLFVLIYFLTAYIKRTKMDTLISLNMSLLLPSFVLVWLLICSAWWISVYGGDLFVYKIIAQFIYNESSLLYLIEGYLLFFVFYRLKLENNKLINKIAHMSFAVLLIHDHNFVRGILWNDVLKSNLYFDSSCFIVWLLISVIGVYCFCGLIEYFRELIFEKLYNTRKYNNMVRFIDNKFC